MLDMSSCVTSCRHVAVAAVTLFAWPVSLRQAATAAEQSWLVPGGDPCGGGNFGDEIEGDGVGLG